MERRPSPEGPTEVATGRERTDTTAPPDLEGQTLAGTFRVEHRIGSGGMGVVYKAVELASGKACAIKCIHPSLMADASATRRFLQEIRTASKVHHPNIVKILGSDETPDGAPFVVMEYLKGEDLSTFLERHGPLSWRRVAHIIAQVADALSAAHKLGIIHRDIKPANCLRISARGGEDQIKVLDFGLAKLLPEPNAQAESMTSTGVVLGTPGYIAPEVYRGLRADARSDIYALGVMAYRLLMNELPPFKIADDALAAIPSRFQAVIRNCLSHDPDDRYGSADKVRAELRQILAVPAEGPTAAIGHSPRSVRRAFSRRSAMIGIAVAGVGTALSLGVFASQIDMSVERVEPPKVDVDNLGGHGTLVFDVSPPTLRVWLWEEVEHPNTASEISGETIRVVDGVDAGYHLIHAYINSSQMHRPIKVRRGRTERVVIRLDEGVSTSMRPEKK